MIENLVKCDYDQVNEMEGKMGGKRGNKEDQNVIKKHNYQVITLMS